MLSLSHTRMHSFCHTYRNKQNTQHINAMRACCASPLAQTMKQRRADKHVRKIHIETRKVCYSHTIVYMHACIEHTASISDVRIACCLLVVWERTQTHGMHARVVHKYNHTHVQTYLKEVKGALSSNCFLQMLDVDCVASFGLCDVACF
jgi:hypothetical protein